MFGKVEEGEGRWRTVLSKRKLGSKTWEAACVTLGLH